LRKAEEYERMAAECLHLARVVRDAESKAVLLKMAQSWLNLAEYVRVKNGARQSTDGV
jgi:ribosomal protein S15P/S13E